MVVTPEGAWKTRTFRREPEEERWRREDVESVKCFAAGDNDVAMTEERAARRRECS